MVGAGECVRFHWTYAAIRDQSLKQGDIIERSEQVVRIFSSPAEARQWLAVLVLTQSCDLVRRRGGRFRSDVVTLCPIVPLEMLLDEWAQRLCRPIRNGSRILREEDRTALQQLLDRVMDQNEPGLFYLHKEDAVGIGVPGVALLRQAMVVAAEEAHDLLVANRSGRLTEEFRAKLGWLVANIYGRAATRDWDDDDDSKKTHDYWRKEWLGKFEWVPHGFLALLGAEVPDVSVLSDEDILERAGEPWPKALEIIGRDVVRIVTRVKGVALSPEQQTELTNRVRNDQGIRNSLRLARYDPSLR